MFRDLLVHVTANKMGQDRLLYALNLARATAARLTGIHVRSVLEVSRTVRASRVESVEAELERDAALVHEAAKTSFEQTVAAFGVETKWISSSGHMVPEICRAARYADLVITGHELTEAAPERNPLPFADQLVPKCGRPVLVVPPEAKPSSLSNILVAWDGSREAVRAIHDAMPFLVKARVSVVVVAPSSHEQLDEDVVECDVLMDHLKRHGVSPHRLSSEVLTGLDTEAILTRLRSEQFDLIVVGAFSRGPLFELLVGGTTEALVRSSSTPVFMAH